MGKRTKYLIIRYDGPVTKRLYEEYLEILDRINKYNKTE